MTMATTALRDLANGASKLKWRALRIVVMLPLVAIAVLLASASAARAEEEASVYDKGGVKHNEQCINPSVTEVILRDVKGNQLTSSNLGALKERRAAPEKCAKESRGGVQVDGIEAISASAGSMYYSWPGQEAPSGQYEGFIAASELEKAPNLNSEDGAGNGKAPSSGDAPGSPEYVITPTDISKEQHYKGISTERLYLYAPYGKPVSGANFALMTWSWVNVSGGGIARAAVAAGDRFYPSNVKPITMTTYNAAGEAQNGSVTARYGRVSTGSPKSIYGWMVTSHTFGESCYNHMEYVGGGPVLAHTLCPAPPDSNAWALSRPNEELDAFFTGAGGTVYDFFASPTWTLAEFNSATYPAAAGYPSAFARANGELNAYYRTSSGEVIQLYANTQWHHEALGCCSAGDPLAFERANGELQVFFRGTNGGIYNDWYAPGGKWSTQRLGGGSEMLGKLSGFERKDGELQLFFRGTDNGIYNLWYSGGEWKEQRLGCCSAAGNPVAMERSNGEIDVFYRTSTNSIDDIWYGGGAWSQPAELATEAAGNPTAFGRPDGEIQMFYRARQTGAIWNASTALGSKEWEFHERACCAAGDPSAFQQPSGALRVFFRGTNNAIYDFPYVGGKWYSPEYLGGEAVEDSEY